MSDEDDKRRRAILITLGIGAILTAILLLVVDFDPAMTMGGRALISLFAWAFISFFLWSLRGLVKVPDDFRMAMAERRRANGAGPGALRTGALAAGVVGKAVMSDSHPDRYVAPELAREQQDAVRAMVAAMAAAGLFQPAVPDPELLFAGVADWGEPLTPEAIFAALDELHYHHPDIDEAAYMGNLAFVDSKAEQGAALIEHHIRDFDALTGAALAIRIDRIDHPSFDQTATRDVLINLTVGGAPMVVRYRGATKYLSTQLHVALAQAYRALGRGDAIATYWTDQGVRLTRLSDGAVEALNAALGLSGTTLSDAGPFAWLHSEAPFAAGALQR